MDGVHDAIHTLLGFLLNIVTVGNGNGIEIEQGLTSHQTHCRSYQGQVFTGQIT